VTYLWSGELEWFIWLELSKSGLPCTRVDRNPPSWKTFISLPIQTMGILRVIQASRFSRATPALTPLPLPTSMCLGNVLVVIVIALPDLRGVRSLGSTQKRKLLLPLVVSVVEPAHAFNNAPDLRWLTSNESAVGQLPY